jgi:hypothetical protein
LAQACEPLFGASVFRTVRDALLTDTQIKKPMCERPKPGAALPLHSLLPQDLPASPVKKEQNQDDDDEQPNPTMGTVSDAVTLVGNAPSRARIRMMIRIGVDHGRLSRLQGGMSIRFRLVRPFSRC